MGLTLVGVFGVVLLTRGYRIPGLIVLMVYGFLGADSLGHYVVAPLSAHSPGMNATILMEVIPACLVSLTCLFLIFRPTIDRGGMKEATG
ncbi:MAG: hypothetical protein KJT03_06915 [Verrucomicrobiae bacterium]|nr:hypothetical protein [Verrucomicrobiae bacterium]